MNRGTSPMSMNHGNEPGALPSRVRDGQDPVSRLLDETEIGHLLIALTGALDGRRWRAYAALYSTDGVLQIDGLQPVRQSQLAAHVERAVGGFAATQHTVSNHHIELAGDRATSRAAFLVTHVQTEDPADCYHVGGWYDGAYRYTPDGWRVVKLHPSIVWRTAGPATPVPRTE